MARRTAAARRSFARASLLDIATGRLPAKDAGAQVQGATARKAGRAFEHAIEAVNQWYDRQGEALIERVHLPTEGWGSSLRIAGDATVDFTGVWRPYRDGVERYGVAFDTKSVTGDAALGVSHTATKARARLIRQATYLRDARDRHGFCVGFLLYCSELETVWLCRDVDAIAAGRSVPIRTKHRATKDAPARLEHHLPHLAIGTLGAAAIPMPATRRPLLDYLALFD